MSNLTACPACGHMTSQAALECPGCGHNFAAAEALRQQDALPLASTKQGAQRKASERRFVFVFGLVGTVFAFLVLAAWAVKLAVY